jgi:hypothetical protein
MGVGGGHAQRRDVSGRRRTVNSDVTSSSDLLPQITLMRMESNEYISALVIQWRRIFGLRHEENGSGGRYAGRISVQPAMADTTIDGSEDPNFVPSIGLEKVRLGENLLELALTWIPTTVYH